MEDLYENPEPSYYAVITADVRYDKNLEAGAKLLYAEYTSLCKSTGKCFAKSKYFTELYGIGESTLRRWKKNLEDAGYIETCKITGHVFLMGGGRSFLGGGALKNERGGAQKWAGSTYSSINNKYNNSYSYFDKEEEEEKNIKMEKQESEKCYTIQEVLARIRVQSVIDEFWYKLGSEDDLKNTIAEMLNHYSEKGKAIPANLAESRLKQWLKPKFETDEDREEMKKAKKRAEKRAQISETIKHTSEEEKNDGGTKNIGFDDIPDEFRGRFYSEAEKIIVSDKRFSVLSERARIGVIKSKATVMYKQTIDNITVSA